MNKTAIKNFAVWARNKLISEVKYKAGLLGITDKGIAEPLPQSTDDLQFFDIGTKQPAQLKGKTAIEQRRSLVATIKSKSLKYCDAYEAVIEEVAYTWFNRLIAIRFMEVNDYLPSRVRVLSSENPAKAEPDFVTNPFDTDLDFSDTELDLIDNLKDLNKSEELFQFLFIKQCNKLNEILPVLFEKTDDYTELLLNVSFTDKDGVVWHLVHDIPEEYFYIGEDGYGQVEIIGWLYQYYNTEPKDKVFARPSGQKIRKEDVPAATQLFTPDWIVRYMVENSLGRIVINNLTYDVWAEEETKKIDGFKKKWIYYLDDAKQTPEVDTQLRMMEHNKYAKGDVPPFVGTKFLDPCMGSGHILVYAFDVFMDIYTAQGYTERDAAQRIVEKNLYGLELDDRAAQLAYFAVMMKARSYDRRFLTRGIRPNLCSIQESNSLNTDYLELFGDLKPTAQKLVDEFIDAKEYGSILNLKITSDEIAQLESKYAEIDDAIYDNIFDTIRQVGLRTAFAPLIRQAKIMVKKYEVVCTNPPYMGKGMNNNLSSYLKKHYNDSKGDLFSVFIEKCCAFTQNDGYWGMITQHSWMFLSSYEALRKKLMSYSLINMCHLGTRAFEDIGGAVVQTTTFTFKKSQTDNYMSKFIKLISYMSQNDKENAVLNPIPKDQYITNLSKLKSVEGLPFAYWVSERYLASFQFNNLYNKTISDGQNKTGDNNTYVREHWEVNRADVGIGQKWLLYAKGGPYRKWAGNLNEIIDWSETARNHYRKDSSCRILKEYLWYKKGITWGVIAQISFRKLPEDATFDMQGSSVFVTNNDEFNCILGFVNSKVAFAFLQIFNTTLSFQIRDIRNLPYRDEQINKNRTLISSIVENCIQISETDWDSFETSWDFKKHPFLQYSLFSPQQVKQEERNGYLVMNTLEEAYNRWEKACNERFNKLKANEEELNRIFIDIYGLQDELTPEVEDKDVTVRKADLKRDVKSFISYAVGCMFGRYSLEREGLVFAGGNFDETYWKFKGHAPCDKDGNLPSDSAYAGISLAEYHYPKFRDSDSYENATTLCFEPDADNCILISDTPYFEDDIVGRFCEFIKVVYGKETLEDNLYFIANALGNKGNTSREVIRNYFLNDFFKDHCKIYQKRPIYWLFDSGKQNGFKALVYMHRWNADTIGNVRVEYLHRIQRVYEREIEREQDTIDNSNNSRDKAAAAKRKEKLVKQLKETKDYDAMIAHLALSRIDIDLDDGVKVNYEKVQTGQDGKKLQVLAKI